ncbi:hypothetical protein [Aporhodopirellula aestuarii]|uniref:Uncharacterized protein n=1 Tax=Aporhodopirellula aestuarii TaxID=2950107 RepID=A0ABT0U7M1_9BACT|nr:hypothetical protein [Aporhodopirellula aestuarii]MCM2372550.1 hypothetical protein [Aporhodopirellula aestuarii]
MSPTITTFLFEAANFLILAGMLGWLFFNPVRDAIAEYRKKFETDNRVAAESLAAAEEMKRQIELERTNLQSELNEQRQRDREDAKQQIQQLLADARAAADREREQSHRLAMRMSETQADRIAEVAAISAAESVGRFLEEIGSVELQSAFVNAACQQLASLPQGKLSPVKVESSQTLSSEQIESLKTALGSAGEDADFRTDESLRVGLRVSTA